MTELPLELLAHIFHYLTAVERGNTVSRVCSSWRDVCHLSRYWRTFHLGNDDRAIARIPAYRYVLNLHAAHLQELNLCLDQPMIHLFDSSVQLPHVRICRLACLSSVDTERLVRSCPNVKELVIYDERQQLTPAMLLPLRAWPQLTWVTMHSFDQVSPDAVDSTVRFFTASCRHLERVNIFLGKDCHPHNSSIEELCRVHQLTLTHVALNSWHITSLKPLLACQRLTHIELDSCEQIPDEDILALQTLPTLTYLDLNNLNISPAKLAGLFLKCRYLTHVRLKNLKLNVEMLVNLAKTSRNLQSLEIEVSQFTEEMFIPLLNHATQLRYLYIFWTPKISADLVLQIPTKLPHLRGIHFGVGKLNANDLLKKQMPRVNMTALAVDTWFDFWKPIRQSC